MESLMTYQDTYKKGYQQCMVDSEKYRKDHKLDGKSISSVEHPKYFEIDKKWDELKAKLDKPLLEKAYYKVGQVVSFVKTNTYDSNKGKPHFLLSKSQKRLVLFDANEDRFGGDLGDDKSDYTGEEIVDVIHNTAGDIYYETVLSVGHIIGVGTSGAGTGEILYTFDELTPPCPESNPYCMETDIITVDEFGNKKIY